MKIDTARVQNKKYSDAIKPSLQNKSQEYRVLATLKYFFPEKFENFILADKPDLQNKDASYGVEVTIATSEDDMKASREFSNLKNSNNRQKTVKKIETTGHTVSENNNVCALASPLRKIQCEKQIFEKAITYKIRKIETYSDTFSTIGLAVLLIDPPTSEAEQNFPEWISCCIKKEGHRCFDFYYILCYRFLLVCDECGNVIAKKMLTPDQNKHLSIIGRMSAESEIKLYDIEWQ